MPQIVTLATQPAPASISSPSAARTHLLLKAPIASTLLRLAAPNVVVMVVQAAVNACETYFIGWLGSEALAGVSMAFPLVMLMQTMSAGGGRGRRGGADPHVLPSADFRLGSLSTTWHRRSWHRRRHILQPWHLSVAQLPALRPQPRAPFALRDALALGAVLGHPTSWG